MSAHALVKAKARSFKVSRAGAPAEASAGPSADDKRAYVQRALEETASTHALVLFLITEARIPDEIIFVILQKYYIDMVDLYANVEDEETAVLLCGDHVLGKRLFRTMQAKKKKKDDKDNQQNKKEFRPI